MNYDQFSITEIELTHDQAIKLKDDCIKAIKDEGIEKFEGRKKEIQLPDPNYEPIRVFVELQTFTEYDDEAAPFEPSIIDRSVHDCKVTLVNTEGGEVRFKIKGELVRSEIQKRFFAKTPICIEEEITNYFTL